MIVALVIIGIIVIISLIASRVIYGSFSQPKSLKTIKSRMRCPFCDAVIDIKQSIDIDYHDFFRTKDMDLYNAMKELDKEFPGAWREGLT